MTDAGQARRLQPRAHARAAGEGPDGPVFEAVGDDPQLIWTPEPGARQALADYAAVRVQVGLRALDGRLADPCVYLDWGTASPRRAVSGYGSWRGTSMSPWPTPTAGRAGAFGWTRPRRPAGSR